MSEFTITFIIAIIALIIVFFLLVCLFVSASINDVLKLENEQLKIEIEMLKAKNKELKYEVQFQKTVSKTFSDGLEALTSKTLR